MAYANQDGISTPTVPNRLQPWVKRVWTSSFAHSTLDGRSLPHPFVEWWQVVNGEVEVHVNEQILRCTAGKLVQIPLQTGVMMTRMKGPYQDFGLHLYPWTAMRIDLPTAAFSSLEEALYFLSTHLAEPNEQLQKAKKLVDEGIYELKAWETTLGFRDRQLRRWFAREMGTSPLTYMHVLKLQRILEQLRPGKPLVAVALDGGYFDQPHFNRYFKQLFGTSPREYLRQMKNGHVVPEFPNFMNKLPWE